jgi:serine/threonine protein kinase
MEKMDQSLHDLICSTTETEGLTMENIHLLAYQMLLALDYLHSKNIIHRDLKPRNILTSDCNVAGLKFKLADFGISKIVTLSQAALTNCGTRLFMAPEIKNVDQQDGYTNKIDIWSLGATLYYW